MGITNRRIDVRVKTQFKNLNCSSLPTNLMNLPFNYVEYSSPGANDYQYLSRVLRTLEYTYIIIM